MNVSVRQLNSLQVDAYYQVVGNTPGGLPLPVQVFYLEEKSPPTTVLGKATLKGTLYTKMWDQIFTFEDYLMYPDELQLIQDDTDVHLEQRDKDQVRALLFKADGEHEMFQHRQRYGYR